MALITRAVTNVGAPLYSPSGALLVGVEVTFTLVNQLDQPVSVFDAITGERVTGVVKVVTDSAGQFTANLWCNDRGQEITKYICSYLGSPSFSAFLASGATALSWQQFQNQGVIVPAVGSPLFATIAQMNDEALARTNADVALGARIDALALAAGIGNQTYLSATPPTGIALANAGNLWFDTANGNKPFRSDGLSWVAISDTSIATAQAAANAAQATANAAQITANAAEVAGVAANMDAQHLVSPTVKHLTVAELAVVQATSGTNTGDNAPNSNYASDYRVANFIAGTHYLAPNGSAALLTNFPILNQNTTGTAAGITGVYSGSLIAGQITGALGFTPYSASNPNGYTSNAGTVTSVSALTIGTTGTDVSSTVANGTTTPVIALQIPTASATSRGALSAADWVTFNSKQPAGTYATGTGSATGVNTGDNAVNSLYSGLVSNATHTGDATGSGALTVVAVNGQNLAALATGLLKNTTGTGVPSIAVAGTDYLAPNGNGSALTGITSSQVGADASGAAANSQAFAIQRANHTGTQSADTLTDGTTNKAFTAAERTKLSGLPTSVSIVKTATMSGNAGAVTISTAQHNIVEITGTNTAQGNITASLDASGVSFLVTFDNVSGYANTVNSNSSWLIPVGRSNWYYNASLAQFEQVSYTQQQVDALITQIYTNSATFSGAVTLSGGMMQAPLTVSNGTQGGIATYRRSWYVPSSPIYTLVAVLPPTSTSLTGDHTIIDLLMAGQFSTAWTALTVKIANNNSFSAEVLTSESGVNSVTSRGGVAVYTQADGSQNVYLYSTGASASLSILASVKSGGIFAAATLIHPSSTTDTTTTPAGTLAFSTVTATPRRLISPTSNLNSIVYGYQSGQGGTVTQATSKSTGVTLNKFTGDITLNAASLAAGTVVSFVLTNSNIAASSLVNVVHNSAGTMAGYTVAATPAAGSATIYVRNNTAGALAEAIVLRFAITQAQTA